MAEGSTISGVTTMKCSECGKTITAERIRLDCMFGPLCLACQRDEAELKLAQARLRAEPSSGPWFDYATGEWESATDEQNKGVLHSNAEKLLSALREMGAVNEDSHSSEGALRRETGLTEREYRKAMKLLRDHKAVRTKSGIGVWLAR